MLDEVFINIPFIPLETQKLFKQLIHQVRVYMIRIYMSRILERDKNI